MSADRVERARGSFEQRSWGDAFADLSAARREGPLGAEDLERLALAAYMISRDEACEEAWTAAHREWVRRGRPERAARCALWQAIGLFFRGDLAPAMGWLARGGSLLEESGGDSVERAWVQMLTALPGLFGRDPDAYLSFVEAGETADRLADRDAAMFARLGRGYALIGQGQVAEGMPLLDAVRAGKSTRRATLSRTRGSDRRSPGRAPSRTTPVRGSGRWGYSISPVLDWSAAGTRPAWRRSPA